MNLKKGQTRQLTLILAIVQAIQLASAQPCSITIDATSRIITVLTTIGYPIGVFMMVYMGTKWIVAEGPEDRENARRGIIYVFIGILMFQTVSPFVVYMLC